MIIIKKSQIGWEREGDYDRYVIHPFSSKPLDTIQIQIVKIYPRMIVKKHYHSEQYEFMYVLSGSVRFEVNGREDVVHSGDFMIVEPNEVHSVNNYTNVSAKILVFKHGGSAKDIIWIDE